MVDMYSTFADLTGQEVPTEGKDSINVLPALIGTPTEPLRTELLAPGRKFVSYRSGKWLYLPQQGSGGFGGTAGGPGAVQLVNGVNSDIEDGEFIEGAPEHQLYDMEADPNQTQNIVNNHPELAQKMRTELQQKLEAIKLGINTPPFNPDPSKVYHIENPTFGLRLAANGSSEDAYTTTLDVNNDDTRWVFVPKGNGYYHIQRAAGGENPRLRTDNTSSPDMHTTSKSGAYTYYSIDPSLKINGTYYLTLPDGPAAYQRLRILNTGGLDFSTTANVGSQPSLRIVEAKAPDRIVNIVKRTAPFGLHSNNGSSGGALNLHSNLAHNNLKFNEIDRGSGFYSYERFNSAHSIASGNGGANGQNVFVWSTDPDSYNQQWQKVPATDGSFTLRKRNALSYGIHAGGIIQNLSNVNMHSNFSHQNLHWFIIEE